ncbi:MAG TPA: LuxR C-terminal-related transcriptional regulator [Micromonosporaceae bacterium]|jgi:DNA-binding CsgD family transcriptional regulator
MRVPSASVVGREHELDVARQFVADITAGPAALAFEGIAGIGKTAIWAAAVLQARAGGLAVRVSRCGESDAAWAFAGLGDLFDGLDPAILSMLPEVQRRALTSALLLADGADAAPAHRTVGVAVLGVLRLLSDAGPLLLAVDDIQWLDPSSRQVLSFALRRLADEPVRLLASCRTGVLADAVGWPDLGVTTTRVTVGPVSIGVLQRIVQARIRPGISRPTLTRLHQATGGNPMLCLEMTRALQRRGHEPAVGEPLPVSSDLRVLVSDRLASRTDATRRVLMYAAAMARPTVAAVTAAADDPDAAAGALSEAVRAGLIEFDGDRIHFTHPLIASVPYADLSPDDRRRLHTRLAASVTDPEERARHAALGSTDRSATVADALDVAARHARHRGSIDAAAELAALAVAATPVVDRDEMLRRTVDAAEYLFLLGDTARARTLVAGGLDASPPGPHRVRGLLLAATIASWEHGDATVADRCHQAMAEAGEDVLLRARCHATLADTSPSGAAADLHHAERAVALLETMDAPPPELLSNALTNLAVNGCRLGRGLATSKLERAAALQADAPPIPVNERASLGLGMYLKVVDRFDESRTWLHAARTAAVDEGDDSALPNVLGHLATLECWYGRYDLALTYAIEGREHAVRTGLRSPVASSAHVLTLAYLGRLAEARAVGEADLAADEAIGFDAATVLHRRSLGVTALIGGDVAAAANHLVRALVISVDQVGIEEPGILRAHADAVTALVALGRIEEAYRWTGQLEASTRDHHRPWSAAMAARCNGLLRIATGDTAGALAFLDSALDEHQRLPMPFEEAGSRMLYANLLRRSGRRSDARREFEAARTVFVRLGTPIQAEQAATELASLGGRSTVEVLTPVEERLAVLAGAGATNREIAAALFISVRTVESHLGRIYRKLGLRSRTELSRHI